MEKIRIAIVDDNIDWVKIIERKLSKEDDLIISWTAMAEKEAVEKAKQFDVDIIVMDIDMNGEKLSGVKAAIQIKQFSSAKVVMLSSLVDEEIIKYALSVVIEDYVFKDEIDELPYRLRRAFKGNRLLQIASHEINHLKKEQILSGLSVAVREVFDLLMDGFTQVEIQDKLLKSSDTIKTQTKIIRQKMGTSKIKQAIYKVRTLGLLDLYDEKNSRGHKKG